jgi:hypothetical protein
MKNSTNSLDAVAFIRAKLAAAKPPQAEEAVHESAESPMEEIQEHSPAGYEAGEQEGEPVIGQIGDEEGGIEQLLAKLSPEELEQLAAHLSADMKDPQASEGGEDVASLAHAIQGHLAENPEAAVETADPQKIAALNFVKSAAYIEGFLNQAIETGVTVKQAVDLYDKALTTTIENLKEAELSGGQHKLDVDNDGKIESADLKKLRTGKKTKSEKTEEHSVDAKTAAYYEGVIERAREYGIPDVTTLNIVKAANDGSFSTQVASLLDNLKNTGSAAVSSAGEKLQQLGGAANDYIQQQSPLHLAGAGVAAGGLGTAAIAGLLNSRKKEKQRQALLQAAVPQFRE